MRVSLLACNFGPHRLTYGIRARLSREVREYTRANIETMIVPDSRHQHRLAVVYLALGISQLHRSLCPRFFSRRLIISLVSARLGFPGA